MDMTVTSQLLLFSLVGFGAQLIDGALGMAYGVINMTVMLAFGIPPAVASASGHTAEIVTTGISGLSHAMFKNIDYQLFKRLVLPGMIGSIIGAYLLTKAPTNIMKPMIAIYLMVMGLIILYRAFQGGKILKVIQNFFVTRIMRRKLPSTQAHGLIPLGLAGGFFDAAGGGGWGPIVTSSLLAQETTPHYTIGTVSFAEFLITLSSSLTFFFTIGIEHWPIIVGLLIGGAIAAPIAAYSVRHIHPRMLMLLAGTLVILLSIRTMFKIFI